MSQFDDIIILSRNTKLTPSHMNKTVKIHNGKKYCEFLITRQMIGLKIGCFLATRCDFLHKKTK